MQKSSVQDIHKIHHRGIHMYKNLNLDFEYKATTHQYIAPLTNMPKNVYQLKEIKEKSIGKEKETRHSALENQMVQVIGQNG